MIPASAAAPGRDSPDDGEEDARHVRAAAALVIQVRDDDLAAVEADRVCWFAAGQQAHGTRPFCGHRLIDDDRGRLGVPD